MRAPAVGGAPAASDISPAVLAIGRTVFPQVLIGTLRSLADVGHCMVFSFDSERSTRCLLDVGNIPIGSDLGAAYSEHYHSADPNREALLCGQASAAPIVLPNFARRMYSDTYRKIFFDDSRIVDKFATAIWLDSNCYYVNFYRTASQGRFDHEQLDRLLRIAPAVSAIVARHFQYKAPPESDPTRRIGTLFSGSEPFTRLTGREKDICLGILSGLSSEAISANLSISLHSTLTYRKRAYDKLGISSQNELFSMVLRLLCSVHTLA
jgi:DNA-binding CsgD family transcriptional regulator